MEQFGFWLFIGAIVVAGIWSDARKKSDEHETLRRIVEKTGTIDEANLKRLFSQDGYLAEPGQAYRGLRICGTIVMFLGAGIATFALVLMLLGKLFGVAVLLGSMHKGLPVIAVAAAVAVLGLGLFLSSRFATPPPAVSPENPAR